MDSHNEIDKSLNAFEKVLLKLPGFAGYMRRELRRDADKLQRLHLVTRLRKIFAGVQSVLREVTREKGLERITEFDTLLRAMSRLINELEYADRGYSGFFDLVKVGEEKLDAIYRVDADLLERMEAMNRSLQELEGSPGDGEPLHKLRADTEALAKGLEMRRHILRSLGDGTT